MEDNKILIVDDEKAIITLMEQAFSRGGYQVISARSGEEALALLKKEKVQVIFLDLNLSGMNGIDLCKKIKTDMPMANLFAMTGYVSLFELSDCREAGFDDYFCKPIDLSLLLKAAKDAFDRLDRWKKR